MKYGKPDDHRAGQSVNYVRCFRPHKDENWSLIFGIRESVRQNQDTDKKTNVIQTEQNNLDMVANNRR